MVPPEYPTKTKATPFISGVLVAFFLISLWSYATPPQTRTQTQTRHNPTTSYHDSSLSDTNWDDKRKQWLSQNPQLSKPESTRVIMVTGSQPGPCQNPVGDNLLLRLFKNKVDYCRIHGYNIVYNNVVLDPNMPGYWAKYPVIRSTMLAHPEAEWIWWVDSDALITDMNFSLPLEKYKSHNLVVHGSGDLVYGLNAGVFLIRNCQWSMDLLDRLSKFSPISPEYNKWTFISKTVFSAFSNKYYPESDDQRGLAFMLVMEGKRWRNKIYLENEYYFEGYWVELLEKLDSVTDSYKKIKTRLAKLRVKHSEKGEEAYWARWDPYFKANDGSIGLNRPFITYFTGCQPCNGKHNEMYSAEECWGGMNKALNFADNQVLKNFGYFHADLRNSSFVKPISFN